MPTIVKVPLGRAAKFGQLDVDLERLHANHLVYEHVYMYGLRQILNDAIASKEDKDGNGLTDEELVAKAQRRLDALYAGDLRVTRAAEPVDPVEREAHRMAWDAITAVVKKLPEYAATSGKDRVMATIEARGNTSTREDLIAKYLTAHPECIAAAKRIVAERGKITGDLGIDV